MTRVNKMCICGLCIAIGCILPACFHAIGLGTVFSPLHFPPLLCGLICGPFYGFACGVLEPAVCSLITGMPPAVRLIYLIPEIGAYGFVTGIMMKRIRTGKNLRDAYISMVCAMAAGKVLGCLCRLALYGAEGLKTAASALFIEGLPGIILHLAVIPVIYLALIRSGVIKRN